ncbi:dipeptide/oligopeptide/nickel ABC transporter permease/ATP-binding protein [Microbacterium immunditiarum]|uniref:ABC-type dipeptide/oligopeptide/nickel transport system ATPase component/ABC-type dipeptide/oligopeptide/nickel transport system permease subunit n=1 Tax=Microbacterium immunditiarum TaxID=337480 RepID=A0A7Y9KJQ0_9MICO|nr:dipeptide/oligopeptide/nickel ABC transporter permease/ATP-binding protein [Microbacterium immunditiarum]NYE18383.1 ABC-type dipeptide/oligopeptide/nickel transport system ATPase component/ABC-type dipeptide/oligopeptide/nickel transport system permease subunit [Microbacterium immunditiarum]
MSIGPAVAAESLEQPLASGQNRRRVRPAVLSPIGLGAIAGSLVLAFFVAFGPLIWGEAATVADLTQLSAPPSPEHPLGTDAGGRDVLARVLTAAQLSVLMALAATFLGVTLGVLVGFLPTILPRRGARFVVSATGIALAFPALLLTIVVSIVVGTGILGAVLAIGFAMVPFFARLAQTLAASVSGRDYVLAARVLGVGRFRILLRHVLPNVRDPLIVNASIGAGGALVAFAGLSFLGLGVQAPQFDWGRLLNEGLSKIYVNPATALAPGIAVVFAGVVFTLIGETLAQALGVENATRARHRRPLERPAPSDEPVDPDAVLTVRGLRISVPAEDGWTHPVDGVDFDVMRGEIVGIVGESGSGKSLTCMAVAALVEEPLVASAQSVRFDGREVVRNGVIPSSPAAELAHHLGTRMAFVFQDPSTSLNPALHVGPQVAEIGRLHENLSRREADERMLDRLRAVQIDDPERRAHQYPHEYSGGMRQRAMIASGLMGEPALIIADEPTTALDVTVQREVLSLLNDINREKDVAILLVSHDIAVVTSICTRVLVMYRGRVVEDITTDDLVAGRAVHPYTRALVESVPTMDAVPGSPFATIAERERFPVEQLEPVS